MKFWFPMKVETTTYHSFMFSSFYVYVCIYMYQPNPWKKRVELSKPGFELVSDQKRFLSTKSRLWWSSFATTSRKTFFPPKFFHWKLEWRTEMDVEILLKFYLSVRIMLVNVDKNVQKLFDQTCLPVVPGSPNLYLFVGLECLRSICLQNLWILYRFEIYVYIIYIIPSSYY